MAEGKSFHNGLPPGTMLDGYRIEEILGAGGFGITYRAVEAAIDRTVAIKEYFPASIAMRDPAGGTVIPSSTTAEEDFEWGLDRFTGEAKTLVSFEHPNIVTVYRFLEANGTAYMVMAWQEGDSLSDIIIRDGPMRQATVARIADGLLDGLEVVHRGGILHRDLKPANIYIRNNGQPVLLDFGSARAALGAHTASLTVLVSAGYAPYEQYDSRGNQGTWTDIYSVAASLYRCITGEVPADATSRVSAKMRGEPDPLKSLTEIVPDGYDPAFLAAIDLGLNVLENDRPQTVANWRAAFAGQLDDAAVAETLLAKQNTPSARTTKRVSEATAAELESAPSRSGARPAGATPPGMSKISKGAKIAILTGVALLLVAGVFVAYLEIRPDDATPAAGKGGQDAARAAAEVPAGQEEARLRKRAAERARFPVAGQCTEFKYGSTALLNVWVNAEITKVTQTALHLTVRDVKVDPSGAKQYRGPDGLLVAKGTRLVGKRRLGGWRYSYTECP